MYFDLDQNILAYVVSNVNKVGGVTKHLVVTPPDGGNASSNDALPNSIDEYLNKFVEEPNASEFTITFKPIYRAKYTDKEIAKIVRIFLQPYKNVSYILIPEYGEHYNLHYHGIITGYKNVKSTILKDCKKFFGRTEIKNIQYSQSYLEYLKKERRFIDPEFYDKLIIYNIL